VSVHIPWEKSGVSSYFQPINELTPFLLANREPGINDWGDAMGDSSLIATESKGERHTNPTRRDRSPRWRVLMLGTFVPPPLRSGHMSCRWTTYGPDQPSETYVRPGFSEC
jgi:hypothetical protein